MKSTFIDMVNGKAIVKLEKDDLVEWLVCIDFDNSKPEGSKWSRAAYFDSLLKAVEYAKKKEPLYLIALYPVSSEKHPAYAVIRGRKAALEQVEKFKDYLSEEDITEELKRLEYSDIVHFGDHHQGSVLIMMYELGTSFY